MNRLQFIRSTLGTIAATVVGSKLGMVPKNIPARLAEYPLTPAQAFPSIGIKKGLFNIYDVVRTSEGQILYVTKKEGKLIGSSLDGTTNIEFIELEDTKYNDKVVRLCSTVSEGIGSNLSSSPV